MEAIGLSLQLVQTAEKVCTFLKNVKNAPEELQRVSNTVESVRNISKNVHTVLVLQQSQPAQGQQNHPRPPLRGIEDSLRKCDEQLRPLEGIAKMHGAAFRNDSSKLDKFCNSIRLGLKNKDIAEFHTNVHREMDFLKMWLELNSHHYNARILPAIQKDIRTIQQDLVTAIKTTLTQVIPVNDVKSSPSNITQVRRSNVCYYNNGTSASAASHSKAPYMSPPRRSLELRY